jgi:hypothetical protein
MNTLTILLVDDSVSCRERTATLTSMDTRCNATQTSRRQQHVFRVRVQTWCCSCSTDAPRSHSRWQQRFASKHRSSGSDSS